MKTKSTTTKKPILLTRLLSVALVVLAVVAQTLTPTLAGASQITLRSLTLVAGVDGGSKPGGVVNHAYAFTVPGGSSVGSIKFEYCTTPADTGVLTCIMPTGLVTTSATLNSQTGATGFSMVNT